MAQNDTKLVDKNDNKIDLKQQEQENDELKTIYCNKFVELISSLREKEQYKYPVTMFHSSTLPAITISDYCHRINEYCTIEPCIYVVAFIYLKRMLLKYKNRFCFSEYMEHRLVLLAICIASKMWSDIDDYNDVYAKVGGISAKELHDLEVEFCFSNEFNFFVSDSEYNECVKSYFSK